MEAMFDTFWENKHSFRKAPGDPNAYTTGRIGEHNVVLAHMPGMGKVASASTAASFRPSFGGVRLVLVVGICGGVPTAMGEDKEMLLGDIVVSTAIVQFDFGRQHPNGMKRKDTLEDNLSRPNQEIRAFLRKLEGVQSRNRLGENTVACLKDFCNRNEFQDWRYPGADEDVLYPPTYRHKHQQRDACNMCAQCNQEKDEVCQKALELSCADLGCDSKEQVPRNRLKQTKLNGQASTETTLVCEPEIHFGRIASGDVVVKSGLHRDAIATETETIAFEMEGAGVWDNFPTVVIKGICDYADSHKNKKWQKYAAASAAALTKAFLKEWREVDRPSQNTVAPDDMPLDRNMHFHIPRLLNPLFTGRTEVVQEMQDALNTRESLPGGQRRFVLTGLGGQGKSEICIKVANLVRQQSVTSIIRDQTLANVLRYWGIFWVDVHRPSNAEKELVSVAKKLGHPAETLADARHALANTSKSWLLILDNADDPNFDYQIYFPPGDNGAVIMTSRVTECSSYGTIGSEAIEGLDSRNSIQLLLKASNLAEQHWPSYDQHAKEVVKLLGSHTLALIQAGAYIAQGHCELGEYTATYQRQRARLLKYRPKQAKSRYGDVYTTFEASAEALECSNDEVAKDASCLLNILSMLDFGSLPSQIFEKAWKQSQDMHRLVDRHQEDVLYLDSWHVSQLPAFINVGNEEWDSFRLKEASSLLASLSFVTNTASLGLSMHPLAHSWAKDRQDDEQCKISWIRAGCLLAIAGYIHSNGDLWCLEQKRLRPHVLAYLDGVSVENAISFASTDMILKILLQCGQGLEQMFEDIRLEELLKDVFRAVGADVARPDSSLKMLPIWRLEGIVLKRLGQTQKAVDLLQQVLSIHETMLVESHANRVTSPHLLAKAYVSDEQVQESIELFQQVLQIRERTLPETHSERLASQHELAGAYLDNKQVQESIELFQQVVQTRERVLIENNQNLLASQHELAGAYLFNGQVQESIELFKQVVQIRERTLPETHSERLASQHELAGAYLDNKQVQESIELFQQVVQIRERTLPETHSKRLASQHELAGAYLFNGQVQESIELFQQVVQIQERTLPETHSERLASQHELARAYLGNRQVQESIELFERVVQIKGKVLPESHPHRLLSQHELARAYLGNRQVQESIELFQQVVQIQERTLPETHSERLASQHELAGAYLFNGQVQESIELFKQVVQIQERTLPETHSERLASQHELARAYLGNGQVHESIELFERVVQIEGKVLPESHPDRLVSQYSLAVAYEVDLQPEKAIRLLEHVVRLRRSTLVEKHPDRVASETRLVHLQTKHGKFD
ncbi:MAG: hypothetical protein M1822_008083 [Bathelium mastoideum]|nr:MAG: hypothetical protein M1822_008083 [Bathelium mastoideum]